MTRSCFTAAAATAIVALAAATPVLAAGDLLVAPTRIILEGGRGTEVILNNVGAETATYRVELVLRRMDAEGKLQEVVPGTETDKERATQAMVSYAPRRVTLAPNQPQVIRIAARFPEGLGDGEYRAHLLFRGIPAATPVTVTQPRTGVSIALTPIYGVTIPVIVRKGALSASAALSDATIGGPGATKALAFTLTRSGDRSVYGRVRVLAAGKSVYEARGLAIYAELARRSVVLPLTAEQAAAMTGPLTLQYLEDNDAGGLIAEAPVALR